MGKFEKITDETSESKPFSWVRLEQVSADHIALQNQSAKMTQTSSVNLKDKVFQLSRCTSINLDKLFCSATLKLGGHRLTVCFAPEILKELLNHSDIEMMKTLSEKTAKIFAENLFLNVITFFEDALGAPCTVELFQLDAIMTGVLGRSAPKIFYKLGSESNDKKMYEMFITGDPDLLFRIAKLSESPATITSDREKQHNINVQVYHFGYNIVLSRTEFDDLCVGDGLVVEQAWSQRFDGHISIGGHRVGPVKQRRQNLVLTETPMLHVFNEFTPNGELDMPLKNREKTVVLGDNAYDEMPVQLSLQLAKHSLPLSKIGDLAKGDIVPFETVISNEVRIFANGDIFAEAELVELNGKFAVRIREILV